MNWNHRICKERYDDNEVGYGVKEVYYNSNGEIVAVTKAFVAPYGETEEELAITLERMTSAFKKDIIDLDTLVFAKEDT